MATQAAKRKSFKHPCPVCGKTDLAEQFKKTGFNITIQCESCGFKTHHFTDEMKSVRAAQKAAAKPDPRETHNVGSRRRSSNTGNDDGATGNAD